jgi:hypothetical protein
MITAVSYTPDNEMLIEKITITIDTTERTEYAKFVFDLAQHCCENPGIDIYTNITDEQNGCGSGSDDFEFVKYLKDNLENRTIKDIHWIRQAPKQTDEFENAIVHIELELKIPDEFEYLQAKLPNVLFDVIQGYLEDNFFIEFYNYHNGYYPHKLQVKWGDFEEEIFI